jgi:uncharacterized protein (DUF952 family)
MSSLPEQDHAVFHLTTPAEWAAAQQAGEVVPAGFAAEGFVHCSTGAQLASTIERHFGGHDELVLLRLDQGAIAPEVRWEEGRPGELFPHVYRPLRLADVVEAISWRRP